jgi:four helix bundle protein
MEKPKCFEELRIWQSSKMLVVSVYSSFSDIKDYAFKDQICRASISVMNNIAEGFERNSDAEFQRYLKIAKASCGEVRSMLYISSDLNFLNKPEVEKLISDCIALSKQISALISYLKNNPK